MIAFIRARAYTPVGLVFAKKTSGRWVILAIELSKNDVLRLRKAMTDVGKPSFFDAFRRLLRPRVPFATFLMLRFDRDRPPVLLDQWIAKGEVPLSALAEYIENSYPFDPFYQFRDVPPEGGLYRMPEIAPDRFFSSEYYLQYYRNTGLCDEVGLLAPLPSGSLAHLSISRLASTGPFRRREMHCLKHHAPVLLELLAQHCCRVSPDEAASDAEPVPPLADLIRAHASNSLRIALTRREAQMAALVLQGHSNGSAALSLKISRETCKVHRRNLYRKLEISSQRDLFGLWKHLL